jgi:hypothetical protein
LACDGAGGINGRTRSQNSSLTSHGRVLAIDSSFRFPSSSHIFLVFG